MIVTQFRTLEGFLSVLRDRLTALRDKTAAAKDGVKASAYWVGDHAEEKRIDDDQKAGAVNFKRAHNLALTGLAKLDAGDQDGAAMYWDFAQTHYVQALEARLTSQDISRLTTSAKLRGRPPTMLERDRRLVEAVEEQVLRGVSKHAAAVTAIRSDPILAKAFEGMGLHAIRKAIREGKKA